MIQIILCALGAVLLALVVFVVSFALVMKYVVGSSIVDPNEQEYENYD